MPPVPGSFSGRLRQAWTIATIELRRVFLARRGLWVYALALLPALVFLGHAVESTVRMERLAGSGLTDPAVMNSVRKGEPLEAVKARLGKPAEERWSVRTRRVGQVAASAGTTTHVIEPGADARFVRLNVTEPTYEGDEVARVYEFEVFGGDGRQNLAVGRPVTGSLPCSPERGPEKAVNGSVGGGPADSWCSEDWPLFLQVDLGTPRTVTRVVVKHASAGGEGQDADTRDFNVQVSADGKTFRTVASSAGAGYVHERTEVREVVYFDGRRDARLVFIDGTLDSSDIRPVLDFEEDRRVFAGIFQYFYLRLALFFGCLGMFMNLFSGEMSNRTLHYWFLAPARREVVLAGKYAAGLIASSAIFSIGALLAFTIMVWPHDTVQVQTYWSSGGLAHGFWYVAAAVLGCVGYGSVFLAVGLYIRNPIVPAALLLAWEGASGILPHALQKITILYYLQSLCPVPAPTPSDAPLLVQLLAAPAAPASRPVAVLGLLLLTAAVLWIASRAVRRMEISYGAES